LRDRGEEDLAGSDSGDAFEFGGVEVGWSEAIGGDLEGWEQVAVRLLRDPQSGIDGLEDVFTRVPEERVFL